MGEVTPTTGELIFKDEIRQLTTNDPGHADTFNPLFNQLLENTKFNKREIDNSKSDTGEGLGELRKEIETLKEDVENIDVPVKSVNGEIGDVTLTASDVGAASTEHGHAYSDITGKPNTFPPSGHTHTPEQVGLKNVLNYGVATVAEAQAGVAGNKYMTPALVKAAVNKYGGGILIKPSNNIRETFTQNIGFSMSQLAAESSYAMAFSHKLMNYEVGNKNGYIKIRLTVNNVSAPNQSTNPHGALTLGTLSHHQFVSNAASRSDVFPYNFNVALFDYAPKTVIANKATRYTGLEEFTQKHKNISANNPPYSNITGVVEMVNRVYPGDIIIIASCITISGTHGNGGNVLTGNIQKVEILYDEY